MKKILMMLAMAFALPSLAMAFVTASPSPDGETRTVEQPTQLFYDGFDAALDTAHRWSAASNSGSGNATTSTGTGGLTVTLGTNLGYSYVKTLPTFQAVSPGHLCFGMNIKLESGEPIKGGYRFWGAGTPQSTPSLDGCPSACSNTILDGFGYEVNTDGKFYAVAYNNGVRSEVADLTSLVPKDGAQHNYSIQFRPIKSYWYMEGNTPVAESAGSAFEVSKASFPAALVGVQKATGTAMTLVSNILTVSDTARNNLSLSDGAYGWRKATVKQNNRASQATDTSLVVSQNPLGGNPCSNPSATLDNLQGTTTGTASVQLLALSSGRRIHVCSANIVSVSGTTPTFSLTYGTGAACATGTGTIIPAIAAATTAGVMYVPPTPVGVTPASNALCYVQTGTTPVVKYNITYVQQ